MRRITTFTIFAVGLLASPTESTAQHSGMRATQQRGFFSEDMGIVGPPMLPEGIASLVLARSAEFALTDSQRVVVAGVRRMQDSVNTPRLLRLDSLRPTRLPAGGPNDLSPEQRTEADARRSAIKPVLDSIRETHAFARQRIMAVLDPSQQKRLEKLDDLARKNADKDGRRRMEQGKLPFVLPEGVRPAP